MQSTFYFSDIFKGSLKCFARLYALIKDNCILFRCSQWQAPECSPPTHGSMNLHVLKALNTCTKIFEFSGRHVQL
jgi:hypothetical protein